MSKSDDVFLKKWKARAHNMNLEAVNQKWFEFHLGNCKRAFDDDEYFKIFKQKEKPNCGIIEIVSSQLGQKYFNFIKENNPDLLELFPQFKINDKIGKPLVCNFGNYQISPTTVRYIKILGDLKNIFHNLDTWKICEVGGGYGGQACIINTVFDLESYTDIDLEYSSKLFVKYCNALGFNNVNSFNISELDEDDLEKSYDLFISNYALCELTFEQQKFYLEKVIARSRNGYIIYTSRQASTISATFLEQLKKIKNIEIYNFDLCNSKHPIYFWRENPLKGSGKNK